MDETGIPSYAIADNPEYKVAISAQATAENSKNHLQNALNKAKLGVKLKIGLFGGHEDEILEPKTKMTNKYAVAESYQSQ
jgi:hypothetical protein